LGLAYFKEKYTKEVTQADKINPEGNYLDWFCKQQPLTENEIQSLGPLTEQDFIVALKDFEPSA
jgi:hypothetical protein